MPHTEKRVVQFEQLNFFGKAIYVGGAAARLTSDIIDLAIGRAVDVVIEAEKAYRQGLDPKVEEAKILEEQQRSV